MALGTFSSRILGLVREQIMASMFGASGLTDAFTVAYRVPNMLRDLFAEGAFSSAFVPVFTEAKTRSDKDAKQLLLSLFILLGSITSIISILIIIFAPEVVHFMTEASFVSDPERFNITVTLVRIMAPFLVVISLAALFMGVLNSLKVFFIPAFAPTCFNIVMILSMLCLTPYLSRPILALGIGVMFGGVIQMLVQLPVLIKKKYGPIGIGELRFVTPDIKKIFDRLGIGTIGIAATQINILITTIIATGTQLGAVSWLTYAFRLFQFPVGILGVSVAGSNLVHFSDAWKENRLNDAKSILQSSFFLSLFLIILSMAIGLGMNDQIVQIVFERGAFDQTDTQMTAVALRYYLYGLPFYGLYKIFGPTFFALDRPKVPVFISIAAIVFNIVFCLSLTDTYGFQILALGTTLSMVLNSFCQGIFISKTLKLKPTFFINLKLFKILLAGIGSFYIVDFLKAAWFLNLTGIGFQILCFVAISFVALIVYLVILAALGESALFSGILKRRKTK